MVTIARQNLGLSIEVPQEIKFGDQIYALPPATKNYVPNPNIISGGATPSIMVELGKALLKSAEDGDTNEVKNLIGRGAPMTADWLGTSPLHKAALHGHYQTSKMLLSSGCSRDAKTKVEKTALHLAASGGHSSIIELLLNANSEANPKDMLDMTPLHWAVESGDIACVELLLRHGADVETVSRFDKTPLEIASDRHYTDIYEMLLNADSYRSHPDLESEIATRTISTELNAHADQYELTETITVPPEAAHTEIVESLPSSSSKAGKFLSNFGIKMLEEEDADLMQPGQTLSLTEAGKRLLSDTSPAMKTVNVSTAPKMQTIQIKQEGSPHPKIIRINGNPAGTSLINSSAISASSSGQPRVIRLSSSQLSNLKLATSGGFKGQKVMIVSSGANKVTNTATVSPASSTIKIVQVGKQPQKQIAIMQQQPSLASKIMTSPALTTVTASNDSKISSTFSVSGGDSVISASANTTLNTKDNLKRKLELMEEELERDRLAMEGKMAKIRKLKAELIDAAPEANDQYNLENNDDTDHT